MKARAIWCEPFLQACRGERTDARVRPDEIPVALDYFRQVLGQQPTMLYLNRNMISRLEKAVPEGIALIERNGVASWEIWGEADDSLSQVLGEEKVGATPEKKKEVMETSPNPPDSPHDAKNPLTKLLKGKKIPITTDKTIGYEISEEYCQLIIDRNRQQVIL